MKMKALPSITSWVIAAAVWAATLLLLLAHQSQLQAEVRAVHAEGTELRRRLLLLERPDDAALEAGRRRQPLSTMAGADVLTHVSSDSSSALSISSDVAVEVESVRFTSANIGVSADTDLLGLASGEVTVNGNLDVTGDVKANGFQANGGTTFTSTGTDMGPEIYSVTGTDYDCTQSSNRGYIWVQTCRTGQDCLCYCGVCDGCGGYSAYCINM